MAKEEDQMAYFEEEILCIVGPRRGENSTDVDRRGGGEDVPKGKCNLLVATQGKKRMLAAARPTFLHY